MIVGSSGGAGANPHLQLTVDIVRELAAEEGLDFKLAIIPAEVGADRIEKAMGQAGLIPCGPGEMLTREDLARTVRTVAQMGLEPLMEALRSRADVIVAGRAYDPAVIAALPVLKGFNKGLALHMGKILECAAIACTPGSGGDCMFGVLRHDHFLVHPLNPIRRCTIASVSAHTLYEKSDPYRLPGPGGMLDLTRAVLTQENENTVRVSGSHDVPGPDYLKLEGAALVGDRMLSIAGVRDLIFIAQADSILEGVRAQVAANSALFRTEAIV